MSRLPHVYPEGKWLFLTWCLHGAFSPSRFPPPRKASAGEAFVYMDRYLDQARSGPTFLRKPEIAECVIHSMWRGEELRHYELGAFCVMPNHVHVLVLPIVQASELIKGIKGATARDANLLLDRTGEPFWQRESYDHWVRGAEEWARIRSYIENNPVKAGLVATAEEFLWSSAHSRWRGRIEERPGSGTSAAAAR